MAGIWTSIVAAAKKIGEHLGLSSIFHANPDAVISKEVIEKLTQAPYNLTRDELEDVRFWWREGLNALNAARSDPAFTIGEQIDAEVVSNNGDFGDPERVLQFAQAAAETAGNHWARVERCTSVGLANTDKDFSVLRGRILVTKLVGGNAGPAWQFVHANAGAVWVNWVVPFLRAEMAVITAMLGLWVVCFGTLIVGWFLAESHGRYDIGYLCALLGLLTTIFSFTIPIQIVDGNLTLLGSPARVIRKIMEEAGVTERPEPGKVLRWGQEMLLHFRWRSVIGVLIASVLNHVLVGVFGWAPEVWWLVFGSLMLGVTIGVILQQEGQAKDAASKAYYRGSRIGLTCLFPILAIVTIGRLGIHGDLSEDGTWLVRTGLEVARQPLRYNLFQSVTTGMAIATALGAVLALAFKKWGPAVAMVAAAIVVSGMNSCSTHYAPPKPVPAPISAWEDPEQSPFRNGDIAGPTPASATAPPSGPTGQAASYDARRARAEALRERARK